jgi:Fur family transcriptional regulator, ferric uptake regulator
MTKTDAHADLRAKLQAAKLRVTGVRLRVLEVLAEPGEAIDAQEVERRAALPAADRVTIYRTLNTLVDAGLAHRVDPGDRIYRFSLTSHAHCEGEHHHHEHLHMVCDTCGSVRCLDDAEVIVQTRVKGQATPRRLRVFSGEGTLHGICERCEATGAAAAGRRASPSKKTAGRKP